MTKKISALTAVSSAAGTNEIEVNEAGTSKKASLTQVKALMQVGTTTNDSAAAGTIGEYLEQEVLAGAAVAVSTSTSTDIVSRQLTAGDWMVQGVVAHVGASGTVSTLAAQWLSATSATPPTLPRGGYSQLHATQAATGLQLIPTGIVRFSLANTTTIYLTAYNSFSVSTLTAYGIIKAWRVR